MDRQIIQIQTYFAQKPEVVAVYLYGSQVRGKAKKTSDIDLGVVLQGTRIIKLETPQVEFSQELSEILNKKVEVKDLRSARLDFAHRVLSEGVLIFSADEKARIEFETDVLRNYFDLKPFFEEYYRELSQIARRGEVHVRYL